MERSKKEFEQVSDATIDDDDGIDAVCDGTQNVKQYRYRYFLSGTKYFRYPYRYLFRYQIFPILVPRFFPIPNSTDTDSETFSGTKVFR